MKQKQEPACSACRFFRPPREREPGECRRHAPPAYDFLRYYHLELLREIAFWASPEDHQPDTSSDVATEATEAMADAAWPRVRAQDWCGEFEPANTPTGMV